MEPVRRIGIYHDLDSLAGSLGLRLCFLYVRDRDAGVLLAVEAEQRAFQLIRQIEHDLGLDLAGRTLDRSVPGDGSLQVRIVRGIQPGIAPAAAEAGFGDRGGATLVLRRPGAR